MLLFLLVLNKKEENNMNIFHGTIVFKNRHGKAEIVKNFYAGFKAIANKLEWVVTIGGTEKNDFYKYLKTCVYGQL